MIRSVDDIMDDVKKFSKEQTAEALTWMALGRGNLVRPKGKNAYYMEQMDPEQYDYACLKAAIIGLVTKCSVTERPDITRMRRGKTRYILRLESNSHPKLTKIWDRVFGPLGRKMFDGHALAMLGPIGLSLMYQDYGILMSHGRKGPKTAHYMYRMKYGKFELERFIKCVVDKFGIIFRTNRAGPGHGYNLRLREKDNARFDEMVSPYIVPSNTHKIPRGSADR